MENISASESEPSSCKGSEEKHQSIDSPNMAQESHGTEPSSSSHVPSSTIMLMAERLAKLQEVMRVDNLFKEFENFLETKTKELGCQEVVADPSQNLKLADSKIDSSSTLPGSNEEPKTDSKEQVNLQQVPSVQLEGSTKPVEFAQIEKSTKPVETAQAKESTKQVEIIQTEVPTKPVEFTQPKESTKQVEITQTEVSTKPDESAQPKESTKPVEITQTEVPTKPVELTQLDNSTKPVEPAQPKESSKLVKSAQPTKSAKPDESAQPIELAKSVESTHSKVSKEPELEIVHQVGSATQSEESLHCKESWQESGLNNGSKRKYDDIFGGLEDCDTNQIKLGNLGGAEKPGGRCGEQLDDPELGKKMDEGTGDVVVQTEKRPRVMQDGDVEEEGTHVSQQPEEASRCPMVISSKQPFQLACARKEFVSGSKNNFLKGCKWSPDGTCILTNSDDGKLRLFNLPTQFYNTDTFHEMPDELTAVLKMDEGELIYDFCWYPEMISSRPETCCFVSVCRDHPVHMWDAFDGALRCTYKAHDHLDERVTPHSVAFSLTGAKLYCGFNKMIKVFDIARPGRDCTTRFTKNKDGGQSGIISCFAMSPEQTSYAAGTYSRSIGIYTDSIPTPVCVLYGQVGGVTHLMYSRDGHYLYSGGRKDQEILCWDVRQLNQILYKLPRNVTTNQRMYFDIDSSGQYLTSGNQEGSVSVWDLSDTSTTLPSYESSSPILMPTHKFPVHEDTVNGVSFHPSLPILATTSGQRKFHLLMDDQGGDSDYETEEETPPPDKLDNSFKLWSLYHHEGD